jgi:hypothetical protein
MGRATIAHFSPNEIAVKVEDAKAGDLVVLNQNWDPGWRARGAPAVAYHDAAATVIGAPNETIVFRYRPHFLGLSLVIFFFAAGGIVWAYVRRNSKTSPPSPLSAGGEGEAPTA